MGLKWGGSGWVSDNVTRVLGSVSGTVVIPVAVDTVRATIVGDTAFTTPPPKAGGAVTLVLTQGAGVPHVVTVPGARIAGGGTLRAAATVGAVDVLKLACYDGAVWVVLPAAAPGVGLTDNGDGTVTLTA